MSIKAVSWALEQYVTDPVAKLVLIGIADRYNDERGYAWPSVAWLSKAASVSDRTVRRKLRLLEEQEFLATTSQTGGTSHYRLNIGGGHPLSGGTICQGGQLGDKGGADNCVSVKQYNNDKNNNKGDKKKQKLSEWSPSKDDIAYAVEQGVDAQDILESIRLWDQQNGNKAAYASCSAFWMNWCRREAKRFTGTSRAKQQGDRKAKKVTARQEAMIDNLVAKYRRAYQYDDPDMIRGALTQMMAEGLDIEGWYKMGHGLKHHTEF